MSEKLIKPYEVSVWEEKLTPVIETAIKESSEGLEVTIDNVGAFQSKESASGDYAFIYKDSEWHYRIEAGEVVALEEYGISVEFTSEEESYSFIINNTINYTFEEAKLAVIGSDTMTGLDKIYNPVFHKKANGERNFTFSLKHKYFDPYNGEEVTNPFASMLMNERKIKLHYDGEWYEFIIKEHVESSDEYSWDYTCTDAFVLELSKNGYNLTFDDELNNNQGTAAELVEKTIENTDWKFRGKDALKQRVAEPVFHATLLSDGSIPEDLKIVNADTGDIVTIINPPDPGTPRSENTLYTNDKIYLFYSYVKNQDGVNVQFTLEKERKDYVVDDKNVATETNYRIETELTYNAAAAQFKLGDTPVASFGAIETEFQIYRLVYGQLTTYDPVMKRTVDCFKANDLDIYRYIDYVYTTSNVITNFITNGENFNALEDGTLQGWNPYTDFTKTSSDEVIDKLELVTRPELDFGLLANLDSLTTIEGFLKAYFKNVRIQDEDHVYNTIYNSGIENNTSFVESISQGQEFVFRWRAGQRDPGLDPDDSDLTHLVPYNGLRMFVARYTRDDAVRYGYYYRHINPEDIIIDFEGITPQILNNEITGGKLVDAYRPSNDKKVVDRKIYSEWNDELQKYEDIGSPAEDANPKALGWFEHYKEYTIDDVVQEGFNASTKYVYVVEEEGQIKKYVWDTSILSLVDLDEEHWSNYLPYYYITAKATKPISNVVLSDPTTKIGIFVYADSLTPSEEEEQEEHPFQPIYIQDIQFTRCVRDANDIPLLIGNIPIATATQTEYYYMKPSDGTAAEDVETYATTEALKTVLELEDDIVPVYNEDSEKVLSISASKSNCFNILQTIAETFECWVELQVEHDDNGYIKFENDKPEKYIYLHEYAGDDNYAGFKYGVNLESIERNINSDEIVTKLIVDQSQSEYVEEGYVSIGLAPSNLSGESYILNFDYFYNQGMLDRENTEEDKLKFILQTAAYNLTLRQKEKERRDLEASLTALGSKRNVYTELIDTAKDNMSKGLAEFEKATGRDYYDYQERQEEADEYQGSYYIKTEDTDIEDGKTYYTKVVESEVVSFEPVDEPDASELNNYYEMLPDLTEDDTIRGIIGDLYVAATAINNYTGILTNIDQEYWEVRGKLRGSENYNIKIWTGVDENKKKHLFMELDDFLKGFKFKLNNESEYIVTVSKKYFDVELDSFDGLVITFDTEGVSGEYDIKNAAGEAASSYAVVPEQVAKFKILAKQYVAGVEDVIKETQEAKDEIASDFNNKYSRYIQEGTWSSTDYIDSELYYLDALQVSNTSSQPTVEYTIKVVDVSQLEGFEWYTFDAGDKTYIEDTEFFGWIEKDNVLTPVQEEVIVSEVEWHLDEPKENVITVKNYKTQFEDFFQRVDATVQTVQYNETTYSKVNSLLNPNGTIRLDVMLGSLINLAGEQYNLTSNGSILVNDDVILIQNLNNRANRIVLNSEGIRISSDGGVTWTTAIDGQGINIGTVYTGTLNTNEVIIGSRENPSFRWDKAGISAFKFDESNEEEPYDLQTFVRFDQYGLYGIKDNGSFKASSQQDVLDKAHFAVTWDGFFIKNSYKDGGRVSITSDNDFQITKKNKVTEQEQEVIKIGMLEQRAKDNLYGIRIKGKEEGKNALLADSDGNLTISGTIYAEAGEIGGISVDSDRLKMDYIVFRPGTGIYSIYPNHEENINNPISAYPFWIKDTDGSAIFNNVTVRGSIKTSVFEYEEIQAVGGAFMFRPSSVIKNVTPSGNDLIIEVDKPNIIRDGAWYKLSNYINNDSSAGAYGLVYIYQVSKSNNEIKLLNAAEALDNIDINDIAGGSIIDMGYEKSHASYSGGKANYGIGINSSDNFINLPPRAISLFETQVDHTKDPKVEYIYRAILGTLPDERVNNLSVDDKIYEYMRNTQGIYTDNMYIGSRNKYLAFYTDGNSKKFTIKTDSFNLLSGKPRTETEAGTLIYLSDKDYGGDGISIAGSESLTTWRQIIGDNFGVTSDGTLYATGAHISGPIEITSGSSTYDAINNINNQFKTMNNVVKIEDGSISLGNPEGFHIFIDGRNNQGVPAEDWTYGLGFYAASHNPYDLTDDTAVRDGVDYYSYNESTKEYSKVEPQEEDNPKENGWYTKKDKRIAYINGSKLSIPYTVVLKGMELGDEWIWELNEGTKNLTLKWTGKE